MTDHPDVTAAVETVRAFLQDRAADGVTVHVETWTLPAAGLRVAEVDYRKGNRGACYMQRDSYGLHVCAAVERAVLDLLHFPEDADESLSLLAELTDVDEPPSVRQTACTRCGHDVEGFRDTPNEWRDRGNNTTCPGSDTPHTASHEED